MAFSRSQFESDQVHKGLGVIHAYSSAPPTHHKERYMKTLILGCGRKPVSQAINHDLTIHHGYVDIAWDLNQIPWPWQDEEFGMIHAVSVLEHLYHNLLVSMNEVWRITKLGGRAYVKLPYWRAEKTWADPTHIHKATLETLDQLDPTTARGKQYSFYTPYKWHIEDVKLNKEMTSVYWELVKKSEGWMG